MKKYCYIKEKNKPVRKSLTYLSYLIIIVGTGFMFWSFYPVVSFEIYSRFFLENQLKRGNVLSSQILPSAEDNTNEQSTEVRDYTNVAVWFPAVDAEWRTEIVEGQAKTYDLSDVKEYELSIPKLKIEKAKVVVNGENLERSLIHYIAKSLPGEKGNVVIFGHSTLPQMYNPKNYKTIFTYLPSLDKGDLIKINLKGKEYYYEVTEMSVVSPNKISVLDQNYDDAYLTLITCVPPGTYWKRLVVKAKMKNI